MTQLAAARTNPSIIMVVGVGGAGGNAVNHMWNLGIKGVDFMVCNTDQQALDKSPVELKSPPRQRGTGCRQRPGKRPPARPSSRCAEMRQRLEESGTQDALHHCRHGRRYGYGRFAGDRQAGQGDGNADRRHRHFAAGRRRQDPLRTGVPGHRGAASERRFAADHQQREYS